MIIFIEKKDININDMFNNLPRLAFFLHSSNGVLIEIKDMRKLIIFILIY